MGRERRTHPSYLSNSEAARQSRRTTELVRSVVGIKPVAPRRRKQVQSLWKASPKPKHAKILSKWKGDRRAGETERSSSKTITLGPPLIR